MSAGSVQQRRGITPYEPPEGPARFLSDVIIELGLAAEHHVNEAVDEARLSGSTVGQILVKQGHLGEDDLARALAARYGLNHIDLNEFEVDPEAANLLPQPSALRYKALPVAFEPDGRLLVAMADPSDSLGLSDIAFMTRRDAQPSAAAASMIVEVAERLPLPVSNSGGSGVPVAAPDPVSAPAPPTQTSPEEPTPPPPPDAGTDDAEPDRLRGELEQATAERDRLRAEVDQVNAALEQERSNHADTAAKLESQGAAAEQTPEFNTLRAQLETVEAELQTARSERESAREESQTLRVARDTAESRLEIAQAERHTSRQELETVRAELVAARSERDSAREELETAREQTIAQDEVEALRAEHEALRRELEQAASEAQAARDAAAEELETVRDERDNVESELETVRAEVERLRKGLQEARSEAQANRDAQQRMADAERRLAELGDLERRVEEARTLIERMRNEFELEREGYAATERQLRAQLASESERHEALKDAQTKLQKQVESLRGENASLLEAYDAAKRRLGDSALAARELASTLERPLPEAEVASREPAPSENPEEAGPSPSSSSASV
jgi:hypothetical protein